MVEGDIPMQDSRPRNADEEQLDSETWAFDHDGDYRAFTRADSARVGGHVVVSDITGDHLCQLRPANKRTADGRTRMILVAYDESEGTVREAFVDSTPAETLGVTPVEPV